MKDGWDNMPQRLVGTTCVAVILAILFSCTARYVLTSEYGDLNATNHVLIATADTPFKKAVVGKVTKALVEDGVYVKVISLGTVAQAETESFDAILLVNHYVRGSFSGPVYSFLRKSGTDERDKIIVLTTADDPNWRTEDLDVDAISGASTPDNISLMADKVVEKIRLRCKIIPVNKVALATTLSNNVTSQIQFNEKEPWTGKWKVESTSQGGGTWAMKQEGKTVKSTRESAYEFKGKVQGNQLKGKMGATGTYYPFSIEMPPDGMSFKGTVDFIGRTYHLKGRRIE